MLISHSKVLRLNTERDKANHYIWEEKELNIMQYCIMYELYIFVITIFNYYILSFFRNFVCIFLSAYMQFALNTYLYVSIFYVLSRMYGCSAIGLSVKFLFGCISICWWNNYSPVPT